MCDSNEGWKLIPLLEENKPMLFKHNILIMMKAPRARKINATSLSPSGWFAHCQSYFQICWIYIFLDDMNFDGNENISKRDFPFSSKIHYLGKVVDFIQAVILDRQESCNLILLNSFYAHGVIN